MYCASRLGVGIIKHSDRRAKSLDESKEQSFGSETLIKSLQTKTVGAESPQRVVEQLPNDLEAAHGVPVKDELDPRQDLAVRGSRLPEISEDGPEKSSDSAGNSTTLTINVKYSR